MITAIVVAVGILIILGLVLINLEHHAKKVKIAAIILILSLIYFSVVSVLSSGKVDLGSPGGVVSGVYYYFGWLGSSLSQIWGIGKESAVAIGNVINVNNSQQTDGRN